MLNFLSFSYNKDVSVDIYDNLSFKQQEMAELTMYGVLTFDIPGTGHIMVCAYIV